MSFAEVLAAALVLAVASSGSLRIWAAAATATRTAEQRQELLVQLDGALLAAEAQLQGPLPQGDCQAAAVWMAGALEQAPLAAALQRQVAVEPGGVWLRLQAENLPPRQRWLDAAALGLCVPQPSESETPQEEPSDGTTV